MADEVYEDAMRKIEACEKASQEVPAAEIKVADVLGSGERIFLEGDYSAAISTLNGMVARGADNVQVAFGEGVPVGSPGQEKAKAQAGGGIMRTEREIVEMLGSVEKEILKAEMTAGAGKASGQRAGEPVQDVAGNQAKAQPHAELGGLLGNIKAEMDRAVQKAGSIEKADDYGRLARLSLPDQIAELEKISLGVYGAGGGQERAKAELRALAESAKLEKHDKDSDFDRRLFELRDSRLKEAMAMVGSIRNA